MIRRRISRKSAIARRPPKPKRKPDPRTKVLAHVLKPNRRKNRPGDEAYFAYLHALGYCMVAHHSKSPELTACSGPLEVAHLGDRGLGTKCDHRETLLVCHGHHQANRDSAHRLQKHFSEVHGIDLPTLFEKLNRAFN